MGRTFEKYIDPVNNQLFFFNFSEKKYFFMSKIICILLKRIDRSW